MASGVTIFDAKGAECNGFWLGNICDGQGETCVFCVAVPDLLFGISNENNEQGCYMP